MSRRSSVAHNPDVMADTADLLDHLLDMIQSGELEATSAHAKRMARRIEGASTAFRASTGA
jgi:hypothetical protein